MSPDPRDMRSLAEGVAAGRRSSLARAITLVESSRPEDRESARTLFAALWSGVGGAGLRIGLSGAAGVGKSTLIDSLGTEIVDRGGRVAVLAVDPSSAEVGGSVLADKTRMRRLSLRDEAYIRPSPSGGALGGVAGRTRECMFLCEAAGFDTVIVETLGAGQAESEVARITDVFALLVSPAGGDDMQGVKRGVLEHADLVLVTKEDGDLAAEARRTATAYGGALRLWRRRDRDPEGYPAVRTVSALEGAGVADAWERILDLQAWRRREGHLASRRRRQIDDWVRSEAEDRLLADLRPEGGGRLPPATLARVAEGGLDPLSAAAEILESWRGAGR